MFSLVAFAAATAAAAAVVVFVCARGLSNLWLTSFQCLLVLFFHLFTHEYNLCASVVPLSFALAPCKSILFILALHFVFINWMKENTQWILINFSVRFFFHLFFHQNFFSFALVSVSVKLDSVLFQFSIYGEKLLPLHPILFHSSCDFVVVDLSTIV